MTTKANTSEKEAKLGKRELEGLKEVLAAGERGFHAHWMPSTMKKLQARGLIEKRAAMLSWHQGRWHLTDAGRDLCAALSLAKGEK